MSGSPQRWMPWVQHTPLLTRACLPRLTLADAHCSGSSLRGNYSLAAAEGLSWNCLYCIMVLSSRVPRWPTAWGVSAELGCRWRKDSFLLHSEASVSRLSHLQQQVCFAPGDWHAHGILCHMPRPRNPAIPASLLCFPFPAVTGACPGEQVALQPQRH